jgi:hypothetical protein
MKDGKVYFSSSKEFMALSALHRSHEMSVTQILVSIGKFQLYICQPCTKRMKLHLKLPLEYSDPRLLSSSTDI